MNEQLELEFNAPAEQLPQLWTPDDIYNSVDESVIRRFSEDNRVERKRVAKPHLRVTQGISYPQAGGRAG